MSSTNTDENGLDLSTISSDEKMTLTIRLIRSFVFRNIKHMILHDISPQMTFAQLKQMISDTIQKDPKYLPFRKHFFDTIQLYYRPHEFKPNFLVIDSSLKDLTSGIFEDNQTLHEQQICNETEFSFFNLVEYLEFMKSPVEKWK